jgi:peptidoglycan/xylan/chitin deacetylase (PgdA/CDA1 family)
MYHDVVEGSSDIYAVTPDEFRRQLDEIHRSTGRPPGAVDNLADGDWMITFDDGGASALFAAEELQRRSWRGHFFVATDLVGTNAHLDWDGVRAVAAMGHVIGSHSCSHPDRMADLSAQQLLDEWSRSGAILARELGGPVLTASVPGGLYSKTVGHTAAEAGYKTLFTSLPRQGLRSIDACRLIGRYAIRRDTASSEAAAAAAGKAVLWARQRAAWGLRGAVKKVAGSRYETMRRALLARR